MKVAVSANGDQLDSAIDERFGRCAYFLIVDTEDMSFEAFSNESGIFGGEAGIQSARFIASKGAQFLITGNCGPEAIYTLSALEIGVIWGQSGTARAAIERFKRGELRPASEDSVAARYGMGGSLVGHR